MAFRLGIVGCGSVSERHARAAAASRKVAIVACADTERGRAEDWARRHACEAAYGSYEELVRGHELDGVILATWPTLHRDQVLGCLELGVRAVLCEKALAVSGGQALEIWGAARAAGALVTEGYMYRHHPAIATIDRLLAAGEIGETDSVHAAFSLFDGEESPPDDPARDWRRRLECGGGVPFDLACYCVDACNRFAGARPGAVQAVTDTSARYGTIARLYGLILYENGVVGSVESSLGADANHELRISGSRGRLRLPVAWRIDHPTEVIAVRSVGWDVYEERRFPAPAVDAYRLELEAFAAAARGEASPVPPLEESVVTALVVDALLASGRERTAVAVDVPDEVAT